jgi:hypothetical protein
LSWNSQANEKVRSDKEDIVKKNILFLIFLLINLSFPYPIVGVFPSDVETGTLSIYFMQEQVGYEEYSWEEDDMGFTLTVRGKMTEPIAIEIENLVIRLDKSFIPERYLFKGRVSGVAQDIQSFFYEGTAVNTKQVGGQEQTETVDIKRDAVLLPNPIFSPYMVLTKKFRCGLQEAKEISAYIIPQMEVSAIIEPKQDSPCHLVMRLGPTQIEIETDAEGILNGLDISSQNLRIMRTQVGVPIR